MSGPPRARSAPGAAARTAKTLLLFPIGLYRRWLSPFLPPHCRYYPSCSEYAVGAIAVHGAFRGVRLAAWRVLRCNPFSPGGFDPVPPATHGPHASPADAAADVPEANR